MSFQNHQIISSFKIMLWQILCLLKNKLKYYVNYFKNSCRNTHSNIKRNVFNHSLFCLSDFDHEKLVHHFLLLSLSLFFSLTFDAQWQGKTARSFVKNMENDPKEFSKKSTITWSVNWQNSLMIRNKSKYLVWFSDSIIWIIRIILRKKKS